MTEMRIGIAATAVATALALSAGGAAFAAATAAPRLLVVVSIDQFPADYLNRFAPLFERGGFRRLEDGGADFRDCIHDHAQTLTGPGHSIMLSGAYPVMSGVIGNWWYSRAAAGMVGCVEGDRYRIVGDAAGAPTSPGISPLAMRSTTVGDVLRAATGGRAKVVSVSIKDRGAVMMGGQRPSGCFWFDVTTCRFVTSTYYAESLPGWVEDFDSGRPCARYVGRQWTKLRADVDYDQWADLDDVPYERPAFGLGVAFPHPIAEVAAAPGAAEPRRYRYAAVAGSPFGNDLLLLFAEAAVDGEKLGADDVPDVLTVSFSSNDYVGHQYGPNSQEVMDTTLRTDRTLAELMKFLDRRIGAGRWTLALTSDHGVAPVPEYLEKIGVLVSREDHHRIDDGAMRAEVERRLARRFFGADRPPKGFPGLFEAWDGRTMPFVYVDRRAAEALPHPVSFDALLQAIAREIETFDGVARVYRRSERASLAASRDPFDRRVYRSWNEANGGDLFVLLDPYWLDVGPRAATSHGTPYSYDMHVPMLLYGRGIRPGRYDRPVAVVDLAATLARLLGVEPPPLNEGEPLREALAGNSGN
jgi:arylsulfatase A-like enzyme